jgi:hypothetical protein
MSAHFTAAFQRAGSTKQAGTTAACGMNSRIGIFTSY